MSSSKCLSTHNIKTYCGICSKALAKNSRIISCQICNASVHIKCNETDVKTFNKNKLNKTPQTCLKCQTETLPFHNLTDTQLNTENQNFTEPSNTLCKPKCKICLKTVATNHRKITCQSCNSFVHIKCNQTDVKTYNKIVKDNIPQVCLSCQNVHTVSIAKKTHCGVCNKTIAKNHRNLCCESCNSRVHIKCNKTDVKTYNNIIKENKKIMCINCQMENIPFQHLTELQFSAVNKGHNADPDSLQEASITSTSLRTFFKEINKTNPFDHIESDDEDEENAALINCKYEDLCSFNYKPKKDVFSLFHTNIGSLAKHKEELETILNMLDYKFDIIGISETKLSKNIKPKFNINIKGYRCYHVDTEASKGGSLIYIRDTLNSKERPDLASVLYKSEVLDSTFIEIINPTKKNILVGCVYRHPSMDLKSLPIVTWFPS